MAALHAAPRGASSVFARHLRRRGATIRGPAHSGEESQPLPWSSCLCQTPHRGRRTGTISPACWFSPAYPRVVCPDADNVSAVCPNASGTGNENGKEVHPEVIGIRPVPGGHWHYGTWRDYATARSRVLRECPK